MSMQDVVSDFIIRVNNAINIGKSEVLVLKNKLVVSLCKWLTSKNLLYSFEDQKNGYLKVEINLDNLRWLERRSSPGQRQYLSYRDLTKYPTQGKGYLVLSTSDPEPVWSTYEIINFSDKKLGGELVLQAHVN